MARTVPVPDGDPRARRGVPGAQASNAQASGVESSRTERPDTELPQVERPGAEARDGHGLTAERFVIVLAEHASERVRRQLLGYLDADRPGSDAPPNRLVLGVPIDEVFVAAAAFVELPLAELERLLLRAEHEVRAGALAVMSEQARSGWAPRSRRRRLYELYLRRLDRIDNWDLVDLGAPHVVGGHLLDQPRDPLYALATSPDRWARRTALLASLRLVRAGQLDDACALSELLLADPRDVVQKPIGGVLREVGRVDLARLSAFLDRYGPRMRLAALRYAVQSLPPERRARYLAPDGLGPHG